MDINERIAERVKGLRAARGLSLEALAAASGVSRSNISLIESGRSSPTAVVLDRLSAALGVTVASFFEGAREPAAEPSPLARVGSQPVWTDPDSGYVRRNVSPSGASPIQLVDVVFPPGQRVAYETTERAAEVHQLVWMIDGQMEVGSGTERWQLEPGDCLAMRLDRPTSFFNPGRRAARYAVALVTLPPTRRTR